ncbi:MAG: glycoside hydrolase family 2, partial [Pirellulales bacterium]
QTWRYTTSQPGKGWNEADFDDSSWQSGPGGFGTKETPGTVVRTEWSSPEIWIRRRVELAAGKLANPQLVIHHDEDADVYLNGVLAAKVAGYTTRYVGLPIRPEARKALRAGRNVIAVHCKQTGGGQYIDVGLADVIETVRE